ncbi:Predicted kinase [Streptosporangium subroseum]|uniref:Predicted kinase n=1 Tax=Streptosporangium subroseum TaxID=106412 RepID=A0A239P2V7_9ACTN|nr:AAA family ATPase [Streptosporangium subroseum]SNT61053.1 Predicted kinase [Streptosporangium subroseum]
MQLKTTQHQGWTPSRLREHREAHGLTLEAAGERLRQAATRHGLSVPAANFQTLWGHEQGTVFPGPHYRRAYCLLYEATEPELGFRNPLPGESQKAEIVISDLPAPADPAADNAAAHVIEEAFTKVSVGGITADGSPQALLRSRVVDAWRRRHGGGSPKPILVLVGGYAGSGKTEFSRFLSDITGWAFLDKDSLTRCIVERLLVSLGGDPNDRHSDLYLKEVRPLEYRCLMEAAWDNLNVGTSAILSAPFITELKDEAWFTRLENRCAAKGIDVAAIWVRCDPESMREYIEFRGAARDAWKLGNWERYADGLDTDTSPPTAHVTVDNRLGSAISLADQTREALKRILT